MVWFFLIVLAGVVLYVVSIYNRLIRYRVESENSWSQIDVQLKRRHDLIPNLVETVKGYMQFEKDTLTKVMEARAKAVGSGDMQSRMKAEGEISGLLGRLFAVWENYPDLKANKNAMQLQEELTTTENRIAYSRGHYNDVVANYDALLEQFPSNQVAKMFGSFQEKIFFEMPELEKEVPKVKF
ncbi:MAG: LemA family protein [Elusimicrobia bacterium]|nr:LemA family protein [Elusimicrobiota bacterium]